MAKKQPAAKLITVTFQMPSELHALLAKQAEESGHTIQAEGIKRMAASFGIEVLVRPRGRPKKAAKE